MHPYIRTTAAQAGFTEDSSEHTLLLLPYGAEQTSLILSALGGQQVDTITSILALCSVPPSPPASTSSISTTSASDKPYPKTIIRDMITQLLVPGGTFLFFEHVLNRHPDVARIQRIWSPYWSMVFDGCMLDRPTDIWVRELGIVGSEFAGEGGEPVWSEGETEGIEGESELHNFWHQMGRFVKRGE